MEDELLRLFGDKTNNPLLQGWAEDQAIDSPLLTKMIERAQKKVESHYFDQRKHTLDYDDVMNVQREKIYTERRRIMLGADLRDTIVGYLAESVAADVAVYAPESVAPEEWDFDGLYQSLNQVFPLADYADVEELHGKSHEQLLDFLTELSTQSYEDKEHHFIEALGEEAGISEIRNFERRMMLQALDRHWMEHLSNMEYLREGIGWRGYAGIDPLVLYKKEAYDMFNDMLASLQEEVVRIMSFIRIAIEGEEEAERPRVRSARAKGQNGDNGADGSDDASSSRPLKAKSKVRR